jgi:hypothetical protein
MNEMNDNHPRPSHAGDPEYAEQYNPLSSVAQQDYFALAGECA